MATDDKSLPSPTIEGYARWFFETEEANRKFQQSEAYKDSEDLGDFVDGMATLHSFGPNPRTFPGHPFEFDPNKDIYST